jgi:hypothetical protein
MASLTIAMRILEALSVRATPVLNGAEDSYGFGLSAALVVPMGSAGEAGWSAAAPCR